MNEKMTEEQKRKNKNLAGILIGAGVIGVIFGLMAIIGSSASNSSTPVTTPVDNSVQSTSTQTTPTSTSPQTSFGNGTFIVGTDIQPGTYRTTGGSNCYYARLSGFGGTSGEIIANANTDGSGAIVTIEPSDVGFQSSGCNTWEQISTTPSSKAKSNSTPTAPAATLSQPQQQNTSPVVSYDSYQSVDFDVYYENPSAYLGENIVILGSPDDFLTNGPFLPASDNGGIANYIEMTDPGNSGHPIVDAEIDSQSNYTAIVNALQPVSGLPFMRIYGKGTPSASFNLTNGTTQYFPVIQVSRIDLCGEGAGTVVYGGTMKASDCTAGWQTIFTANP
jgi:hypothetical protein